MKESAPKWLRASINYEQGLEQSSYYQKRNKPNTVYYVWLVIIVAAVLALVSTSHHEEETSIQINRGTIMERQNISAAQHAMNQELWIMKTAANSGTMMDQYHASSTRRK